ncbi:MAG: hypothetical protein JOZ77_11360 [Candidatus Eremiobacteraeota bacterium]|nr:hypothetical protein [Candidatus Eremiobacteraeota bacterium]
MKRVLEFLLDLWGRVFRPAGAPLHDDTLRANQGDRTPSFSFWRALVS